MRSSRYCIGDVFPRAAARFRASSLAMTSPSKKSLRAAERQRADVARARRRWIREQGMLDSTRLVSARFNLYAGQTVENAIPASRWPRSVQTPLTELGEEVMRSVVGRTVGVRVIKCDHILLGRGQSIA